ncbi:DMT family transporter [Aquamicrobium segne]|uniref:DMT family transporter n=1 Tax=Aquamicrobium segne TaxID=469547 RepID=A0ABW0GVB0_9HYPH
MAGVFWGLLGIVAGAFVAIQVPINAELARGLGSPLAAAAISFFSGALMLSALTFLVIRFQGVSIAWREPELWLFVVGGMLGAVYVTTSILLIPRIGAAALIAFLITGQLVAGMLIDRIGFLGVAMREISLGRLAGACLLIVGAVMVRYL